MFRVDSSQEIGSGHVMRCLTLACSLRNKGANVTFVCRDLLGNLGEIIEQQHFNLIMLPNYKDNKNLPLITAHSKWLGVHWKVDAAETISVVNRLENEISVLIIDHYAIDKNWESEVRKFVKRIMVIDDLADRLHDCDILLDQNFYHNYKDRYQNLVPQSCKLFLGPEYVLLRDEFYSCNPIDKKHNGNVKKILVFFGGTDSTNETKKTIMAILQLDFITIELDVVIGKSNIHKKEIVSICSQYKFINLHYQINNMAELMYSADLAIGAGGTTTWERCYLGLPSIVITVAPNQELIAQTLDQLGIIKYIGPKEFVKEKDITLKVQELMNNPSVLRQISDRSRRLFKGSTDKCQILLSEILE